MQSAQQRRHNNRLSRSIAKVALVISALSWYLSVLSCASHQHTTLHTRRTNSAKGATISGWVQYEARTITATGYSQVPQTRPARFVTVWFADATGRQVAQTQTDENGQFTITVDPNPVFAVVRASIHTTGNCPGNDQAPTPNCIPSMNIDVTPDAEGQHPYQVSFDLRAFALDQPFALRAVVNSPQSEGGAFHILDTLARGMIAVHGWTRRTLPAFYATWQLGGPSDWSYYRGERPPGSGRYRLELMGGTRGQIPTTDADHHDESIVLHEFGHFVFDMLSTSSSMGGLHPPTVQTDPGVAWEEGRATWFACAVLGDPMYRDAIGITPSGSLRNNDNLEQLPPNALRGLGSQRTVEEILWDLSDGPGHLLDTDNDGLALGPATLMQAMMDQRNEPNAYPSVETFLRLLVSTNRLSPAQATQITQTPTQQNVALSLPPNPPQWPIDLAPNTVVSGNIDGVTNPAPSGGNPHPINGFDAVRVYRIQVTTSPITATLTISGSGRVNDDTDLDLELRDLRGDRIARSATENQIETITHAVTPGTYLLYVRDGGDGNRVPYSLTYH